jgi:hypothetical protein
MTSRQPGTTPPGTTGLAAVPGDGQARGDTGTAGAGHRVAPPPRWPPLVLPVALLILAGLAGLRGGVTAPRWDGPLHGDAVAVAVTLEIVLGTMLAFAIRRLATRARARTARVVPASPLADTLRQVPAYVLGAGMIAVMVTLLVGLRQHLFSGPVGGLPGQATGAAPAAAPGRHFHFHLFALHLHVTVELLYGLLVLVFLGAVALRVGWTRWFRPSGPGRVYHYLVPDSQDLLEVVESGRSALRAIDDARAAIIACYVAMEASLAEHGAARAIADTPDELLTRATALGIVRGTAAARLTTLFYEARFSSHPLDRGHRDAAAQALGELAAELTQAETAGTRAPLSRASRSGARA